MIFCVDADTIILDMENLPERYIPVLFFAMQDLLEN